MLSPIGKVILELRADSTVAAITDRIRGSVPGPGDVVMERDPITSKPQFRAFVIVDLLGTTRDKRVPIQRPRYSIRCYGRTPTEATDLRMACSDALHDKGLRQYSNGLVIFQSFDDADSSADMDPVTDQPLETFIVELVATAQAVAV